MKSIFREHIPSGFGSFTLMEEAAMALKRKSRQTLPQPHPKI